MSEFKGLWKHQNNPVCTKSVRVFRVLELDIIRKTEREGGSTVEVLNV